MRLPSPLMPGARVALVAPAGPLGSATELERAVEHARSFGWDPVVGEHALARHGYLAGTDEERARDLNASAIDVDALRRHPKAIIGFSDITALHAALGQAAQLVTFHGPTARGALADFSRDSLARAVVHRRDLARLLARCTPSAHLDKTAA